MLVGASGCSHYGINHNDNKSNNNNAFYHNVNQDKETIESHHSLIGNKTPTTTLTNVSMASLIPFQVTNMPKHKIQVKNLKAKWNNINRDVIYILYEIFNKAKRLRHNISTQALKQYDMLTEQIVQSFANNHSQFIYQSQQNLNANSISKKFCSIEFFPPIYKLKKLP